MAKSSNKSVEELAAERQARLGISSAAQRVAVPPASAATAVSPAAVEAPEAKVEVDQPKKSKEQRLCIIVSREQALKVKRYALENDTTVSDLLRGFIDSL